MKRKIILLTFVALIECINAQTNDSTYLKYLNNNKFVPKREYHAIDSKNILKTDVFEIFNGNIPIIWEHRFTDHIALDGGVGLILPYSFIDFTNKKDPDNPVLKILGLNNEFVNKAIGYSIQLEPKVYFPRSKLFIGQSKMSFISVVYNMQSYKNLNVNKLGVGYGYCIEFGRLFFQASSSLCYIKQSGFSGIEDVKYLKSVDFASFSNSTQSTSFLKLNIRFQIGYILSSPNAKIKKHQ